MCWSEHSPASSFPPVADPEPDPATDLEPDLLTIVEARRGPFVISTDPRRLDRDAIHAFLAGESYWARGIARATVDRSIDHSLNFGLFQQLGGGAPDRERQVGFARVVTDTATFANLADVYVLDELRGQGLGVWLMEVVMAHPALQGLRRFTLGTQDAHGLYAKFGFTAPPEAYRLMEIKADTATLYGGG